jgi:hypothetical protein
MRTGKASTAYTMDASFNLARSLLHLSRIYITGPLEKSSLSWSLTLSAGLVGRIKCSAASHVQGVLNGGGQYSQLVSCYHPLQSDERRTSSRWASLVAQYLSMVGRAEYSAASRLRRG